MERPVMSITDLPPMPPPERTRRRARKRLLRMVRRAWVRRAYPTLVSMNESTRSGRFVRGVLYRLALLPAIILLVAAGMTFKRTHPIPQNAGLDPSSEGIYFQSVKLMTEDHTTLDAWLVPALDARQILTEGDRALHQRHPAVVLAHGFGMSRRQVMPLIAPLHSDGWVVLALDMRGSELPHGAGQTFGLNEALDLKAAVDLLRGRPYVDPKHIAVVGIDSGANAAVLAADRDASLSTLVLDGPVSTGQQAMLAHLTSQTPVLKWFNPLYSLAFEVGYDLNIRDLDLDQYNRIIGRPGTLTMQNPLPTQDDLQPSRVIQIVEFLQNSLATPPSQTAGAR